MTDQQTTPAPEFTSPKDAEAHPKAGKANSSATGPWFKKTSFILPLVLIVVVIILVAIFGRDDTGTSDAAKPGSQPKVTSTVASAAADIGTKVRDGKLEFVVTGVEHPGKTFAGKLDKKLTAQGEFVVVRVDVTNVGDQAQNLDCSCQLLFNDKGQKFEPSSAILNHKDALKFVELIDPGTTVTGAPMLFDVAPGTKLADIELHDSQTSQGVKVKLP